MAPFSRPQAITGPTADRKTVIEAIAGIRPGGRHVDTRLPRRVCGRLPANEDRRAIILISDGYDENSVDRLEDALRARSARVAVTSSVSGAWPAFR